MRQAYTNIQKALVEYGATMYNLVDELLFVPDMDAASAAAVKRRQDVFPAPQLWQAPSSKFSVSHSPNS